MCQHEVPEIAFVRAEKFLKYECSASFSRIWENPACFVPFKVRTRLVHFSFKSSRSLTHSISKSSKEEKKRHFSFQKLNLNVLKRVTTTDVFNVAAKVTKTSRNGGEHGDLERPADVQH